MITICSYWWKLLISTIVSYFWRIRAIGGLTGFFRLLSNIHLPRFFFVCTFKHKFWTSYRSLEKKKTVQILKIQVSCALFSQSWLWFAQIGENCWFPQGSLVRNYSLGVTLTLFLIERWPEIVRGHPYKNPRWYEVFLAK